ncbi:MAG: response regulator [Patescibacteria group bacterium]|nr:response regulator [Patescibacteria group bacterium]MDD5715919.1 response regulator [Patescibacteria group bacterium]
MDTKLKILLIEDDTDQVFLYQSKFELEGFEMLSSRYGSEGLRIAGEQKPDIILLDLVLIGESGLDVLANLKKNAPVKNIPVIILTNLERDDAKAKAKELGAADFLTKANMMPSDVVRRIREILKK